MRPTARLRAAAVALVAMAPFAGCGPGGGESRSGGVELRVTRGFGQQVVYATRRDRVRPQETVMGLLRSKRRVETSPGGGAVESIEGLGGVGRSGLGGLTSSTASRGALGPASAGFMRATSSSGTTAAQTSRGPPPPSSAPTLSRW